MGAQENECQISQNYIFHMQFTEILPCVLQFLWYLTFIFSDSHEKFFSVLLQMINYIFRP